MGLCLYSQKRKVILNETDNYEIEKKCSEPLISDRKSKKNKNIQKIINKNLSNKNEINSKHSHRNNKIILKKKEENNNKDIEFKNIINNKVNEINNLDQNKFDKEKALSMHNKFRAIHGSNKLELNSELNNIAQLYANECAEIQSSEHSPKLYKNDFIGENIFEISTDDELNIDIEDICNKWYSEKKEYDFNSNKYQTYTGHFTQMIWKDSKEVGFGYKKTKKGKSYFVAIYYPEGNIFNKFKDNVKE